MVDPRLAAIPKTPAPGPSLATVLTLALYRAGGSVILGSGVRLVAADTQADAPSGLAAGTVVLGLDGSLGQVNSSGTLVSRGAAGSLAVASSGAITFDGTDVVFTADGADVDVTGTGKLDLRDDVAHFVDPAAPTKRVRIDAGTVTAGQTRVLAMPDSNVTMGAYASTLLNVADEAAFKAAVNLEAGTDFQAFNTTLTAIAAGSAVVLGPQSSPVTSPTALTNAATIALPTTGINVRLSSASAVTGIIMAAGTVDGQEVKLLNSNAADAITFDSTPATSRVAQAVCIVPAGTSKVMTWSASSSRWFPAG